MIDSLTVPQANLLAYTAATEGAAIGDATACGRIWMRDRDAATLLHRLSTNKIEQLAPGQGTRTVLTTPIGRIIDLLTVHRTEDGVFVVTSPGNGPAIVRHLRKNIFFNDKVKLEDASERLGQLMVYGPRAVELLEHLGLPTAQLTPYAMVMAQWSNWPLYVASCLPLGTAGRAVYAPAEALTALATSLTSDGAVWLDPGTSDVLRVEAGYGAFGREISPEYIPLETGLLDAISFNKGCYVGQEIIARMESRGRLAKQLRGLLISSALPDTVALPAALRADDQEAGNVISMAQSPRLGLIGLAYVRSAYATPGTMLKFSGTSAEVRDVPFL
ncbi:MAG: folate-binding protein YgfZ [Oscillochloris sp.]|nr:folate-binding protein YgfZ [Oscillochloris sp.]